MNEDTFTPHGELTIYKVKEFKHDIDEFISRNESFSIDFTDVSEFDTACLQVMLYAKNITKKFGIEIKITKLSPIVWEAFDLYFLTDEFGISESLVAS